MQRDWNCLQIGMTDRGLCPRMTDVLSRGPQVASESSMFRIKICGITSVADAEAVIEAGADCIGLNFFRGSPRFVEQSMAKEIRAAVGDRIRVAGVFVDSSPTAIAKIASALTLDLVQLSGNDSPEWLKQLTAQLYRVPVMQALRAGARGIPDITEHWNRCRALACLPDLVLWDAHQAGQYGGTGQLADWQLAAQYVESATYPPLVLAGGLKPENVAEAIRAVRPQAVDTASGVESGPGVKDPDKLRSFVRAARAAFDNRPERD